MKVKSHTKLIKISINSFTKSTGIKWDKLTLLQVSLSATTWLNFKMSTGSDNILFTSLKKMEQNLSQNYSILDQRKFRWSIKNISTSATSMLLISHHLLLSRISQERPSSPSSISTIVTISWDSTKMIKTFSLSIKEESKSVLHQSPTIFTGTTWRSLIDREEKQWYTLILFCSWPLLSLSQVYLDFSIGDCPIKVQNQLQSLFLSKLEVEPSLLSWVFSQPWSTIFCQWRPISFQMLRDIKQKMTDFAT